MDKKNDNKLDLQQMIQPMIDNDNANNMIGLIAVTSLLSNDNKKSNSRIKYSQVSELSKLYMYAEVFKIPFVEKLADNILDLQISINGLGRKEIVELVNQSNTMETAMIKRKEIFR